MNFPVEVIINARSGAAEKEPVIRILDQMFRTESIRSRISLARSGGEILELASRAARSDAGLVIAGGGDGTINAVASELVGTDKILGVLPLGTFNYFARNLGLPLDPESAARTFLEGRAVEAHVGEINERIFLNNASIGLYPRILRQREQEYRRWGRSKVAAYFSVLRTIVRPIRILKLRLRADGQAADRRTPLLFICNNQYQMREFNVPGADCMDAHKFAFYMTRAVGRMEMLKLALLTFFQQLNSARDLDVTCLDEAWISTRRRKVQVAIDGEIRTIRTPLHIRLRRGALRVMVPAASAPEAQPDGRDRA
ncbi:MAG TPA: diacylglycerol kinase family protein [Blastocatellia bacterium]|nr:diacylglycerol kinase family protein [Blastocatellia bacterium]